jgi:hypothetical protein
LQANNYLLQQQILIRSLRAQVLPWIQ